MVRRGRSRKPRGRRNRGLSAVPSINYASANTGTTTTFSRSSFQIIAGCGDRSFKIVGLQLNVASFSEPFLVQPHIYNPEGKEVGLGQYLVTESRRRINLRIPSNFKSWFDGTTAQTATLVTIVLLPVYKDQKIKVVFTLNSLFRFGLPELSGR